MRSSLGWARTGGAHLLSRVTRRSWDQLGLADGASVFAQVKGVALAAPTLIDGAGDA